MVTQITPERRRQLAEKHGVNEQYLYQCLTGRRDMGPAEAMRLETETNKELTRQMLCQKTCGGIWPELVTEPREQVEEIHPAKADAITDQLLAAAAQAGLIERRRFVHRADGRDRNAELEAINAGKGA